jgi:hypothetical protein
MPIPKRRRVCVKPEVNGTVAPPDPKREMATALETLFQEGQVIELRVPEYPRHNATSGGYFSDLAELGAHALELSGKAAGIYTTLNRLHPGLLARSNNSFKTYVKKTTSDRDVDRRVWLPLDFDPRRPSDISSTDAEHEAALERARQCRDYLRSLGWPQPLLADSGNGAHLLVRVDLPNDNAAKTLVEGCVKALAKRFSDDVVDVDRTVTNAARIWKCYGTLAAKGESLPNRPHRLARLLAIPQPIEVVTVEQLEALAAEVKPAAQEGKPRSTASSPTRKDKGESRESPDTGQRLDVARWLTDRSIPFKTKEETSGLHRTKYVIVCPFDPNHKDAAVMQEPGGKLSAKCFHNACEGKGWQEFKQALGPPEPKHFDYPPPRPGEPQPLTLIKGRTDTNNALRLVRKHGEQLRWVGPWAKWVGWNGTHWQLDQLLDIDLKAKDIAAGLFVEIITALREDNE